MAFAWPVPAKISVRGVVKDRTLSSLFGPRTHPVSGQQQNHGAIDIPMDKGTPVMASAAGTVDLVDPNNATAGGYVQIDHGNGYWTRSLHLSQINVKKGDKVSMGTVIGRSGGVPGEYGSGTSTGAHLHFEIWQGKPFGGGTKLDPLLFLTQEIGALAKRYFWVGLLPIAGYFGWKFAKKRGWIGRKRS